MALHRICWRNFYKSLNVQITPHQSSSARCGSQHWQFTYGQKNWIPRRKISGNGPVGQEKGLVPTPFQSIRVETGPVPPGNIIKCTIFALAFSAGSFVGAAILEYENVRAKIKDKRLSSNFSWVKTKLRQKKADWRREVETWWSRLTPGEKVFVPICVLNTIVFGLWRIPRLQPFMVKYFCSNPSASIVCWPMCLSTFSHYSLFHIFANMYVLHSFSNAAVAALGKEQFLGLYLSAGVISTLASYIYKAGSGSYGLSLGASGAIMAVLSFVCFEYPDTKLSILFLPMYTFPAAAAIKVIIGVDLAGCILGWKFFDHAAHLGGALFGMFWCFLGKELIWSERQQVLRYWHQLRTSHK